MTCEYRFERKFHILNLSRTEVENYIISNPASFGTLYEPRFINNIYLDHSDLRFYRANIDGNSEKRLKFRVRWYGEIFGKAINPHLEIKIRKGWVNTKLSYPLREFSIGRGWNARAFVQDLQEQDLPSELKIELRDLDPILINRYQRKYYLSSEGQFRATLDWGLQFYGLVPLHNEFLRLESLRADVIVELKYPTLKNLTPEDVTTHFPFRLSRSSKYAMGVERVLGIAGY